MSRDRGEALAAIPVYLHRRFRHGFVFVDAAAGIREPKDLAGKKIGGTDFQVTAIGPLGLEYMDTKDDPRNKMHVSD